MKIALASDLHLECRSAYDDPLRDLRTDADVLVLAGDVVSWPGNQKLVEDVLERVSKTWGYTIWVFGNHAYYGAPFQETVDAVGSTKIPANVEVITTPRFVTVESQRFLCGTMWFDRAVISSIGDPLKGIFTENGRLYQFSDFHWIPDLASHCYQENHAFKSLLSDLKPEDVVVTHHLPNHRSVPKRFRGLTENAFYVSDCAAEIEALQPRLWIHGHSHSSSDYRIGKTRVVARPLGYPGERSRNDEPIDYQKSLFRV